MADKIIDYVSGLPVIATPEEIEAVQVMSRILVEDYGYPRDFLVTKPQYRVKARPSDKGKSYPVDIAIFDQSNQKNESTIKIIVECKRKNRIDGIGQLKDYLRFSSASIGVWYNGTDRVCISKTVGNGIIDFKEIPDIPRHLESLSDIGKYRRKDLKATGNLKSVFRSLRHHLAANAKGITRDEVFAQQIINLIFCKIYDERYTKPEGLLEFRVSVDESHDSVAKRIHRLFELVKNKYEDVISEDDSILLDSKSLSYAVGELQLYSISDSNRDAVADAFETFIGPSLKGAQGQFFTPRNVVDLGVAFANLTINDKIIDPACGSGGFIVEATKHVWKSIDEMGANLGWPEAEIEADKQEFAIKKVRGIDKDYFLSKVAKAYMAIIKDGRGGVFCENSLEIPAEWSGPTRNSIKFGEYNKIITNPPFGKKLKVIEKDILKQYQLGYKWSKKKGEKEYVKSSKILESQIPQVLFIERCLQLLDNDGLMSVILPESMVCNPSHRYVMQFLQKQGTIEAIVSFPEELFQPYTHAKTCLLLFRKSDNVPTKYNIFMATAKWCGHDSRGITIPYDDIPEIIQNFKNHENGKKINSKLGFLVSNRSIVDDIFLPKYYDPVLKKDIKSQSKDYTMKSIGDLVKEGVLSISTGHEVGKLAYGTGHIPFIRTSEIANWDIKIDPKHGLSLDIYEKYRIRQDVKEGDILMVRDGSYLVGSCAIITPSTTKIVYQSHLYKIRSNNYEILNPFYLLAALSSPIVKAQIYSMRFTQDIIDTLGSRINDILIPIPKDQELQTRIITSVEEVLSLKSKAKAKTYEAIMSITPDFSHGHDLDSDFLTMRH